MNIEEVDLNLQWHPVKITPDGPEILTAIREDEAEELRRLATGKRVLEIGSAYGYSAIIMALARATKVTAIDDHNGNHWLGDTKQRMTENLAIFGVENLVEIIQDNSAQAMFDLAESGKNYELIFIDGAGDFSSVVCDLVMSKLLLGPAGTIALHDYGHPLYPGKKMAADTIFPTGPDKLVTTLWIKKI